MWCVYEVLCATPAASLLPSCGRYHGPLDHAPRPAMLVQGPQGMFSFYKGIHIVTPRSGYCLVGIFTDPFPSGSPLIRSPCGGAGLPPATDVSCAGGRKVNKSAVVWLLRHKQRSLQCGGAWAGSRSWLPSPWVLHVFPYSIRMFHVMSIAFAIQDAARGQARMFLRKGSPKINQQTGHSHWYRTVHESNDIFDSHKHAKKSSLFQWGQCVLRLYKACCFFVWTLYTGCCTQW